MIEELLLGTLVLVLKMMPLGLPAAFLTLYARVCGWEVHVGVAFFFSYLFSNMLFGLSMRYLGPELTCWVCVYGILRCTYGPK